MRYGEQVFEIPVTLDDSTWNSPMPWRKTWPIRFHAAHERLYTYALRDQEVVLVNARLSVIGRLPQIDKAVSPRQGRRRRAEGDGRVYLGGWTEVPVFDFLALAAGSTCIRGPAIIESDTTTILLRPGDVARFDRRGWLDVTIDAAARCGVIDAVGGAKPCKVTRH